MHGTCRSKTASFDAVLDKGALDAQSISPVDVIKSLKHLNMALSELARVLTLCGVVLSIAAACTAPIETTFGSLDCWKQIRDGSPYITYDGFTSNNVDSTLLAWKLAEQATDD
jgi:hypothetical protein